MDVLRDMALVLTASVDPGVAGEPGGMAGLTRTDPELRENDYIQALHFYLTGGTPTRRIVFMENSGWALGRIQYACQEIPHDKTVEFVSLNCNDYPRHLGKGYGELMMLDNGLAQSQLLREVTHFVKVTGRLRVGNLRRILTGARGPFDMLCDLRDHRLYQRLGIRATSQRCDSRVMAFARPFYDASVRGRYVECDDSRGIYLEHVLYRIVKEQQSVSRILPRFVTEPRFHGIAGHGGSGGGIDYDSPRQRARWLARWMARKLMPWWYA